MRKKAVSDMRLIEQILFGADKSTRNKVHMPLQDLPVRSRLVLYQTVRENGGTPFLAAMTGAINGAEYEYLENDFG